MRRLRRAALLSLAALSLLLGGYYVYLRVIRNNFHVVVEGLVYRSAQPEEHHLRKWTDRYGLKSVINLRGESSKDFFSAEKALTGKLGLNLTSIRLSAQDLPPRPCLEQLIEALESLPRPMLIHCAEGADRTGAASVLAAMAIGGQPYEQARDQLSARYLHLSPDPDHIAGLFHQYEAWCLNQGVDTGGWQQFRRWAREHYHVRYYFVEFQIPESLRGRPGQRISVPVTIINRSHSVLPASDTSRAFNVSAFLGTSVQELPDKELSRRMPLPRNDLAPGESVKLTLELHCPPRAGRYDVRFDLVEERVTWFARQGSPMGLVKLTVGDRPVPLPVPAGSGTHEP